MLLVLKLISLLFFMSRIYRIWSDITLDGISLINSEKSVYKRYNCGGWFVEVINDSIVQCYSTIETHLLENGCVLEIIDKKPDNWLDSFPEYLLHQNVKSIAYYSLGLKCEGVEKQLVGNHSVYSVYHNKLEVLEVLEDLKNLGLTSNDMKCMTPSTLNKEESKIQKINQEESSRESKSRKTPPHISGRIMAACMVHD